MKEGSEKEFPLKKPYLHVSFSTPSVPHSDLSLRAEATKEKFESEICNSYAFFEAFPLRQDNAIEVNH